jgi:signal transduction histidine kinase
VSLSRRRLFWRVYLTLLTSLVAVAALIGALMWLVGEAHHAPVRVRLEDRIIADRDASPAAVERAISRLGDQLGADISVYDESGELKAAVGRPVAPDAEGFGPRGRIIRLDLADGRIVLARMRPPPHVGLRILSIVSIVALGVGLAAFPVTLRLTRRLEGLRSGVERWGAGALSSRVDDDGEDEVAVVARTFNAAAERIERLLISQKALLANASHELRSPLARLRVAIEIWLTRPGPEAHAEIVRDLAEIDELIGEILLASRLDHGGPTMSREEGIDLLGLAAEEAARLGPGAGVAVAGEAVEIGGDRKLLRRLIRNLLENAAKHGRPPIEATVTRRGHGVRLIVSDRGATLPADERERVFKPFHRPAGRGEASGGWGLGLSLARQIAELHGGAIFCEPGPEGGNRFVVDLPAARTSAI